MRLSRTSKLLYSLATTLAVFAALEGFCAWREARQRAAPGPTIVIGQRVGDEQLLARLDHALGWKFDPGALLGADGERANSFGFRGPEPRPVSNPNDRRILCVGSGLTFGVGVGPEETYAAFLERWLRQSRRQSHWDVLNAGVPGYTSIQALGRLRQIGHEVAPSIVILCVGSWHGYTAAIEEEDDRILGVLEPRPRAFPWSLASVRTLAAELRPEPPAETVAAWSHAGELWRHYRRRPAGPRVPAQKFEKALRALVAECRKLGALPVLVMPPLRKRAMEEFPESHIYARLVASIRDETKATQVDARQRLEEDEDRGGSPFLTDWLLSRDGHARVAAEISRALCGSELAESLPETPFEPIPSRTSPIPNCPETIALPGKIRAEGVEIPRGALLEFQPAVFTRADLGDTATRPESGGRPPVGPNTFEVLVEADGRAKTLVHLATFSATDEAPWKKSRSHLVDLGPFAGSRVTIELRARGPALRASFGEARILVFD